MKYKLFLTFFSPQTCIDSAVMAILTMLQISKGLFKKELIVLAIVRYKIV